MSRCAAVIVAAGVGRRSGLSEPKQFVRIGKKPALLWSVDSFVHHQDFNQIIVAVSPEQIEIASHLLQRYSGVEIIAGGAERTDTVEAAIKALQSDPPDLVFIHDAARPFLSHAMINSLLDALTRADAAAPALAMTDAVKSRNPETSALQDVDRSALTRVQTPQAFRFSSFAQAMSSRKSNPVDDLSLAQSAGLTIELVAGHPELFKLTYPEDFSLAQTIAKSAVAPRIGQGFDVHGFEPGNKVTLCGIEIAHSASLRGHSDADVAWHALTDAVLGALSLGDIGVHFPPSDAQWKGAPSSTFLTHAANLARDRGYEVGNADITIICESPKISPHMESMRRQTAELLQVDLDQISIKATTTEKLGFTGRKEGIAAQANVLMLAIEKF